MAAFLTPGLTAAKRRKPHHPDRLDLRVQRLKIQKGLIGKTMLVKFLPGTRRKLPRKEMLKLGIDWPTNFKGLMSSNK